MSRNLLICFALAASFSIGAGISWLLHPIQNESVKKTDKAKVSLKVPRKNFSDHYKTNGLNATPIKRVNLNAKKQEPLHLTPQIKLSKLPSFQRSRDNLKKQSLTKLVAYSSSPFPYKGIMPHNGKSFLNFEKDGRQAHKTGSGRIYFADETYNEQRVLLHIPKSFDINKPAIMVLFFHGHRATLERDIIARQQVPQQISKSGVNAVLVAPQFAKDARDSSPGKFWQAGAAKKFIEETERKLSELYGRSSAKNPFSKMPILIIGYSGGFMPTAWTLARGGIDKRVKGVVLLDGLYNHLPTFSRWIKNNRDSIFLSAYTNLTKKRNLALQEILTQQNIPFSTKINQNLNKGSITFLHANADHHDFVTKAWTSMPIRDVLVRLDKTLPVIQK